jgi:chemotaxis protein CheD
MHTFYDSKFKKNIVSIGPGEYYISEDDIIIQTVLGSCISVCLFSLSANLCGMNHFMLPGNKMVEDSFEYDSLRYGWYAMEILINSFLKNGINKNQLKAKVFGGGNVIDIDRTTSSIGDNNVKFVKMFLEKENIPIESQHLGGENAKKILFFDESKKVLMKMINKSDSFITIKEEIEYKKSLEKDPNKSDIILFD